MEGNNKQAGRIKRWSRRLAKWSTVTIVLSWLGYIVLSWIFPFPQDLLDRVRRSRISTAVLDREGHLLRAFTGREDTWTFWTKLDEINPRVVEATIAVEDERFYLHPGVDPIAAVRAAGTNLLRMRTVSGASTIPMQVMRLLEDRPRTLGSKIVESFRALQFDGLLSKGEILEWYLNLAPYGGNTIGVEAASLGYFQKHARDLTLNEAALLAGLPQSPSRLRPDRFPELARTRRDHVLNRMRECGYITQDQWTLATKEPILIHRVPPPLEAPHFTQMLRDRYPGQPLIRSTLDRHIQAISEEAVRDAVSALRPARISNGAVVVIENNTAAVRALVGSCEFFEESDHGQVNGATALRSPGSALKPFVYALAFEKGICTPGTVLADVPSHYSGYRPENYDHSFRGPVTARAALSTSLNVPAVNLLHDVGQPSALHFLRQFGLRSLTKDPEHYGLSLVLGSSEVSLLELTHAYSTLARSGRVLPLRLVEDEPIGEGRRLVSDSTAYIIADILSDMSRLNGRPLWKTEKSQIKMAWKTGTSYGHRDAWMIAYTPEYTVGVWLGNLSGKPARELVGIHAAAPVAARIMDQLYINSSPTWYALPRGVLTREVCADSGMPAGEFCPARVLDTAIHGRSSNQSCPVHRKVRVDAETGAYLCPSCPADRASTEHVVESWPPDLAGWFRDHDRSRSLLPAHYAGCTRPHQDMAPPKIISPAAGQTYVVLDGDGEAHQKVLFKTALSTGSTKRHWFVDGTWLATEDGSEPVFWSLQRGHHTVTCSDNFGRAATVTFEVK